MKNTTALVSWLSLAAVLPAQSAVGEDAQLPAVELRLLATADYRVAGVAFDLAAESVRLRAWLGLADHRAELAADPRAIGRFNGLARDEGGALSPHLQWYPHVIRPQPDGTATWRPRLTGTALAVPLFDDAAWAAPAAADGASLVELVPVNLHAGGFDGRDFDSAALRVGISAETGRPVLYYGLAGERRADYADWTEKHAGRPLALLVDGEVRAAPLLTGRIDGVGVLAGDFTTGEVRELVAGLRSMLAAAAPAADDTIVVGAADGSVAPGGSDPADLRAMQGAQAMLAAEARLRDLLRSGKIEGVDRILTFEEISSWPYEDGLLGMPKQVGALDGKKVLMTGFMLPIDEVENIREFLLVQSLWSCCYGQPPDINGIVRVVMKGDARIDYQFDPIKIIGRFEVEATMEDGYCVDIFQLHADSVELIR